MQSQTVPEVMEAFVLTGHGNLDVLAYHQDWPTPTPAAGQALVKVQACGLNNTDINTRTAWYSKGTAAETTGGALEGARADDAAWGAEPLTFPRIQGADVAGVVVAVGDGVDASLLGQSVLIDTWLRDWDDPLNKDKCGYFGSECDGGFAAYTTVDHRNLHPVRTSLSFPELATFPTAYITALNMLTRAQVGPEDSVLITGASGGVGSALVQLVQHLGARAIALCAPAKIPQLQALGADAVIARDVLDLKAALHEAIGRDRVSVVADIVGGPPWGQAIDCLARGGRYTCSGAIAGPIVPLDLRTLYLRDLTFTGATITPPGLFAELVRIIEQGHVKPLLAQTFPLSELKEAQTAFIEKKHVGNLVVVPGA